MCFQMKRFKDILAAALMVLASMAPAVASRAQGAEPQPRPKNVATRGTVYVFGVADSMRDSTVFITAVQRIDSANLQKKTKFLLDRPYFSSQLKTYFASRLGDASRLCIVYYTTGGERKARKLLARVRKNYLDEGALLRPLSPEEFRFEPLVGASYESVGSDEAPAAAGEEQ